MHSRKLSFVLLSIFSPFMGIYWALKSKSEELIIFAGTFFFGILGSLFIYLDGNDGTSHLKTVKTVYQDMPFNEFLHITWRILSFDPLPRGAQDLYIHILAYISGGIFHIPELLHVFSGFILGYFFTKSAVFIIRTNNRPSNYNMFIFLILLFLTIRSISALNSIRYWTAFWILFYGHINYESSRDKKYLFTIFSSVVIHISYIAILLPILVSFILAKRKIVILSIYLSSLAFSLSANSIESFLPNFSVFETNKKTYTKEIDENGTYKGYKQKTGNFYHVYGFQIYSKFSLNALILTYIISGIIFLNKDYILSCLVSSGFLLISFANFVSFVPELVNRTIQVASFYLVAAAIWTVKLDLQRNGSLFRITLWNVGINIFLISSIPFGLYHLSYALNTISFFVFGLPIISYLLGTTDMSVIDFFRFFL